MEKRNTIDSFLEPLQLKETDMFIISYYRVIPLK